MNNKITILGVEYYLSPVNPPVYKNPNEVDVVLFKTNDWVISDKWGDYYIDRFGKSCIEPSQVVQTGKLYTYFEDSGIYNTNKPDKHEYTLTKDLRFCSDYEILNWIHYREKIDFKEGSYVKVEKYPDRKAIVLSLHYNKYITDKIYATVVIFGQYGTFRTRVNISRLNSDKPIEQKNPCAKESIEHKNPCAEKKLTLKHVILYAKGWYMKSDDIWADLRKCITADDYSGEFFTDRECAELLLRQLERLSNRHFNGAATIIFETTEDNSWKYGYYTKGNANGVNSIKSDKPYDLNESLVRYCLMCIRDYINKKDWTPGRPDYLNCLPAKPDITEEDLTRHFGEITF